MIAMKARLRTQQMYIDLPTPDSEPWLNLIVQRVEMDDEYKTLNVVDRWGQVNARMSDMALQCYSYNDPVYPPSGVISVAGLAEALTVACVDLIIKKYGGSVDEHGYIMVE